MARKRTTRKTRAGQGSPPGLGGLLGDVLSSSHVKPKKKIVNFLVSEAELAQMHATAKALGLTLSGYLRGLHRTAVEALRKRREQDHG